MSVPTDPTAILAALLRCPSVTPEDAGAQLMLQSLLEPMGFDCSVVTFGEEGGAPVRNLYARLGGKGPHLMFAGHTDVVPPGDPAHWTHPPFAAKIDRDVMYGRGAVDMKGAIACFVAAVARYLETAGGVAGSVSLLITGDEEGPAVHGTDPLLAWAAARGERWDAAIVGEPTNRDRIGDRVKVGRRGSLTGTLTVLGRQGHVAYPELADNPLRGAVTLASALLDPPLDSGTERFQPSNLEITSIDTGNAATNVIPGSATIRFNIRHNDRWSADTLAAEIEARLACAAGLDTLRPDAGAPISYELAWRDRPSPVFLTHDRRLVGRLSDAIAEVTGFTPELSTSGGTSDARFIKDYCPVVEFGLVGRTMHMVDESVPLADLETLTSIYQRFLSAWFASGE